MLLKIIGNGPYQEEEREATATLEVYEEEECSERVFQSVHECEVQQGLWPAYSEESSGRCSYGGESGTEAYRCGELSVQASSHQSELNCR